MDLRSHWDEIYRTRNPSQLSWFQRDAKLSLELIARASPDRESAIVDVGAGASTLVDGLLAAGYSHITLLDVSADALAHSRQRISPAPTSLVWLIGDVLTADLPSASVGVWHDRAVFHFLIAAADRSRYVERVKLAVRPGGYVVVATFAEDGPSRCSGLPAARYSTPALHGEFGADFRLIESCPEEHVTPSGAVQTFTYCMLRYEPRDRDQSGE